MGGTYNMKEREQLWYLINGLLDGTYNINVFCDEFTRIYDLELDYDTLVGFEIQEMNELSTMTARFSDSKEDLKIPNVYFSEEEIREKVKLLNRKNCS